MNMKKIIGIATLSLVLMVGMFVGGNLSIDNASASEQTEEKSILAVTGEGVVKIKPDVAYISIGVETEDKESHKAQSQNATKMKAVMDSLKKKGIKDDDIRTSNYYISTIREYDEKLRKSVNVGYRVINSVEVTVRDIENVGCVIDVVSKNGANSIKNINFGTTKQDEYYLEALELAMKNAKSKAEVMAKAIGYTIGKPLRVNECSNGGYTLRDGSNVYGMSAKSEAFSDTSISVGELEIKANVNVDYQY